MVRMNPPWLKWRWPIPNRLTPKARGGVLYATEESTYTPEEATMLNDSNGYLSLLAVGAVAAHAGTMRNVAKALTTSCSWNVWKYSGLCPEDAKGWTQLLETPCLCSIDQVKWSRA